MQKLSTKYLINECVYTVEEVSLDLKYIIQMVTNPVHEACINCEYFFENVLKLLLRY